MPAPYIQTETVTVVVVFILNETQELESYRMYGTCIWWLIRKLDLSSSADLLANCILFSIPPLVLVVFPIAPAAKPSSSPSAHKREKNEQKQWRARFVVNDIDIQTHIFSIRYH